MVKRHLLTGPVLTQHIIRLCTSQPRCKLTRTGELCRLKRNNITYVWLDDEDPAYYEET